MPLVISLLIVFSLLISGCMSFQAKPLNSSEYNQYPVKFEVNYDAKCEINGFALNFQKGTVFGAEQVAGNELVVDNNRVHTLPENVIALKVLDNPISYALILPNGNFASNYPIVNATRDDAHSSWKFFVSPNAENSCVLLKTKPMFSKK